MWASLAMKCTQFLRSKFVRKSLCGLAESPGQRAGGDLDKASIAHPLSQPFGLPGDGRIALRVGNDGRHPRQLKLVKRLRHIRRYAEVRELHQQVVLAIDGVLGGILDRVLDVFVGEVKIAAKAQRDASVQPLAKRGHALAG